MKRIILITAALAIGLAAAAQPGNQKKAYPGKPGEKIQPLTVEQEAQMKVDQMTSELVLTPKQVKKLTSYFKKDITYRRENFPMAGGRGPKGLPPGGGPQGGRPQGMGPGGHPGGGPGMRLDGQGGRPPQMDSEIDFEKLDKYNQKQEKKLRKILGEDNYSLWRSKHPMESPKLPDVEFK